jgi:hypothetical protein
VKTLAAILCCCTAPVLADTIVDIESEGGGQFALSDSSSSEEGWSSPIGYSDVGIAPWLVNTSGSPLQMTYFLTTSIGPGTTISDQISSGNFILPAGFSGFTVVASGLALGPGTYFLTFQTSCPGTGFCAGWEMQQQGASTSLGPGVTITSGLTSVGSPFAAYFPATQFFSFPENGPLQLRVETGLEPSSVPEPSSFWSSLEGLVVLAVAVALRRIQLGS